MNQVAKTNKPGAVALPADFANKLAAGISESRAAIVVGGGKPFIRLLRSGEWVYGAQTVAVQDGSLWALNPMSLQHGWACWVEGIGNAKNELKGEIMVSVAEPLPLQPNAIEDTDYDVQRSFELRCLNGDDEGEEVLFKTTSHGGKAASDALLVEIFKQLRENPSFPCPVLELGTLPYQHPKWGKIYNPVFTINGWVDMNGNYEGDVDAGNGGGAAGAVAEPAEEPAPVAAPKGRGRPAAARPAAVAAPAAAEEETRPEPAPTVGQRRRPAVR